jgi:hypothetical protein
MTSAEFRRLALGFPEAEESAHMNHPDFRVAGKIFATLGYPDKDHGMVIVPAEEQARFLREHPKAFGQAKGAWGKRGSSTVLLDAIDKSTLRSALEIAWRNKAPKDLL